MWVSALKGKYEMAEHLSRRAMENTEKTLGKDHPTFATRLNNLAELLETQVRRWIRGLPLNASVSDMHSPIMK